MTIDQLILCSPLALGYLICSVLGWGLTRGDIRHENDDVSDICFVTFISVLIALGGPCGLLAVWFLSDQPRKFQWW